MYRDILLVEDDEEIARLTSMYLQVEGFQTSVCHDGAEAVEQIRAKPPALVLLDLMLPGLPGLEVCKQLRQFYQGPIIVLTACDDEINEICLLKSGADDFLKKPIRPHILTARIEAALRRQPQQHSHQKQSASLQLNQLTHTFSYAQQELNLTTAEYEMLMLLYQHMGEVVTREQCSQLFRGKEYHFIDRSIDMRISSLRKKLGDKQMPYRRILTVRNKGYMLTDA